MDPLVRLNNFKRMAGCAEKVAKNGVRIKRHWCYQDLEQDVMADSVVLTPWLRHHWEEARAVFGGEIYPYGVAENLPTLEAATRFSHEQHLSARQLSIEELFAAETLDTRGKPD